MDLSYIAGFTDGEGSISCPGVNRGTANYWAVTLTQKKSANAVLFEIQKFLLEEHGIGSQVHTAQPTGVTREVVCRLYIGQMRAVSKFLELVRPHLIVKAATADLTLARLKERITKSDAKKDAISMAVKAYLAGSHMRECRAKFGVSPQTLRNRLMAIGINPKWHRADNRTEKQRKACLNNIAIAHSQRAARHSHSESVTSPES